MNKFLPFVVCVNLLLIANVTPVFALEDNDGRLENNTLVSASLGERKLILWGYGPPVSVVRVDGIGISDSTLSLASGYFQFTNIFVPVNASKDNYYYPEICIQAFDANKLSTQLSCIPPLPRGDFVYNVGPVILSPTLNLEKGNALEGEMVKASGKTIPNSSVNVFLARDKSYSGVFQIVRSAFAYQIPKYEIKSDEKGNFEFNLPNDSPDNWKLFASAIYQESNSAKSNTLNFEVTPKWLFILRKIFSILALIGSYVYYFIVFLQILAVILLIYVISRKNRQHHNIHKVD